MKPKFIILMGVSGCGKTTIGNALGIRLGWDFYDGDDFHTPENIVKMRSGFPLSDQDRIPWLESLRSLIATCLRQDKPGVLACSALKEKYRQILLEDSHDVMIVYLKGSYELIWSRMCDRPGHYMKPKMLRSQFEALEEPVGAFVIDISLPVEDIVESIVKDFGL